VPRVYNRIYQKLNAVFDEQTGCKAWLIKTAKKSKTDALRSSAKTTNGCWDALVFKKAKAFLGGKVRYMITASAPIDKAVLEFLKVAFCCPVVEGYGLTETSGGSSFTKIEDPVLGHVGGPTAAVKWRLKDIPEMSYMSTDQPYPRGEICMQGPTIFPGYYMRPDKTEEAFEDGWFKTGDVAQLYPNGTVKIIDRSKNIFKLSQGEYIAPEKIENIFALCAYVGQTMIYGDSLRSCCVAIIVPNEEKVKAYATE
jgi:long-chain acyl-CoA synthetase